MLQSHAFLHKGNKIKLKEDAPFFPFFACVCVCMLGGGDRCGGGMIYNFYLDFLVKCHKVLTILDFNVVCIQLFNIEIVLSI